VKQQQQLIVYYGGWIEGEGGISVERRAGAGERHQHQHQPSSLTNGSVSRFNCRNTSNGFM
jgi:hypothetical protein